MKRTDENYQIFIDILKEELVPAMGCTEPIALAYAASCARDILGEIPDEIRVQVSGSILKNVKSVIVPNTGQLKGIQASAAAGIIAGRTEKELEVLSEVSDEQRVQIHEYLKNTPISVEYLDLGCTFDILFTAKKGEHFSRVRIAQYHTNIVLKEKDGVVLEEKEVHSDEQTTQSNRDMLTMERIWEFSQSVEIEDIKDIIDRQIECNMAIAEEGLRGDYGANIGSVLLAVDPNSVRTRAKAMAAAGSDARMNGCELPVIINSGSGNQGMTVSLPVLVYAGYLGVSEETRYRALVLSNLTAIHEKTPIGRLSAFCGAVSAGAGAGAGIAYLHGGGYREVIHTIVNALAIVSGMICDGAKASCAAKIAASVDAGILGYEMFMQGQQFYGGDGIITKGVEATIRNVGRLGREGMRQTNEEIIRMMLE